MQENGPSTTYPIEGGCDCKRIRYQLQRSPLYIHCCHCRWCQRETGSAFVINALIEADQVTLLNETPLPCNTPSESGAGQIIYRCPHCWVALFSTYSGLGPFFNFVRVGTLDNPDLLPPDIHIFTASKQPWFELPKGVPAVPEYYDRKQYWPPESLERREKLMPQVKAYLASQHSE